LERAGAGGSLQVVQLELIENPDIVTGAAQRARPTQVVVGFALETERVRVNAKQKLKAKQRNLPARRSNHEAFSSDYSSYDCVLFTSPHRRRAVGDLYGC